MARTTHFVVQTNLAFFAERQLEATRPSPLTSPGEVSVSVADGENANARTARTEVPAETTSTRPFLWSPAVKAAADFANYSTVLMLMLAIGSAVSLGLDECIHVILERLLPVIF